MSEPQDETMLVQDREDVIEVLRMRFSDVPEDIRKKIDAIDQLEVLQRLVLVAANAASWDVFLEELKEGETAFRMLGERFDPTAQITTSKEG